MDERMMQFRVGVMVLASIIIVAILSVLFGELPSLGGGTYTVYIHFPQARGVTNGTPIRNRGILVGRVTDTRFADDGGVIVTAEINSDVTLRRNELCTVSSTLLGDAELEFAASSDPNLSTEPIAPDELVVGVVAADPMKLISSLEGDLSTAIKSMAVTAQSITATSDEIGQLAGTANTFVNENRDQIRRIVDEAGDTLASIRTAADGVNQITGDVASIQTTVDSANLNLNNLESVTAPLVERGPELVESIETAIADISDLTTNLVSFTEALSEPEGTVGRLLNDDQLYNELLETVDNVNGLTRDLRPILKDARVFTDKIARRPSSLVFNGFRQRSGIQSPAAATAHDVGPPAVPSPEICKSSGTMPCAGLGSGNVARKRMFSMIDTPSKSSQYRSSIRNRTRSPSTGTVSVNILTCCPLDISSWPSIQIEIVSESVPGATISITFRSLSTSGFGAMCVSTPILLVRSNGI